MPVILKESGQWVSAIKEVSVTTALRMTATSTINRQVEVKVKVE
jgi:hypothetical protein